MTTLHLFLLGAFGPVFPLCAALWELPELAARIGVGTGRFWPAATVALSVSIVGVLTLFVFGMAIASSRPRLAAFTPLAAALLALAARWWAGHGAPAELGWASDKEAVVYLSMLGGAVLGTVAVLAVAHMQQQAILARQATRRTRRPSRKPRR